MDETTPPQTGPTSAPHSGSPTPDPDPSGKGSGSDRFFSWLRDTGIVRGNERWFAGVAGGIATKSGIDPLIVRGIFVVLAILGGPGILLYLAGWLLLPDSSGRIHVEELFRGRASAGVITFSVILGVLVVLPILIGVVGGFAGGMWSWGIIGVFPQWAQVTMTVIWWALIVPAGIVWLIIWLQRRSSQPENPRAATGSAHFVSGSAAGTTDENPATFVGSTTSTDAGNWADRAAAWSEKVGQDASAWGEKVGKDASAWGGKVDQEAAARAKALHQARRLGAGHVVLTLAFALMAAAGAALWALNAGSFSPSAIPGDSTSALLFAVIAALAVCAVSLIVVGIRGRNSGWIGFFAFCGVVALIFTSVLPLGNQVSPFGNVQVAITDSTSPSGVTVIAGNAVVDLSNLEEQHDVSVWLMAGNATLELPEDMPVVVRVIVGAGNIRDKRDGDTSSTQSGPILSRTAGANLENAKPADVSHITVYLLFGNVNIVGANSNTSLSERFANDSQSPDPAFPPHKDELILEKAA